MKGVVLWYNKKKNYGFIRGNDGESYFVHTTELENVDHLEKDDEVTFKPESTNKGYKATGVNLI